MIVGVDEAGRGPLAGPVVAAAVVLCDGGIDGLNDSKVLAEPRRRALEARIKETCRWAVGVASVEEIDRLNILWATMLAMERAVEAIGVEPAEVLVDGNRLPRWRWPARAVIGGDGIEPCISAASIIAKQARDAMMADACGRWPGYGFSRHKGYGTAEHRAALARLGPCPIHRRSFAPVREQLDLSL